MLTNIRESFFIYRGGLDLNRSLIFAGFPGFVPGSAGFREGCRRFRNSAVRVHSDFLRFVHSFLRKNRYNAAIS